LCSSRRRRRSSRLPPGPPFLYELSLAEARAVLDELQAAPIDKPPVNDRWITVPADVGDVRVRIVRPPDAVGTLPVILYMHGGGWVLGNADTHDRLVRELAPARARGSEPLTFGSVERRVLSATCFAAATTQADLQRDWPAWPHARGSDHARVQGSRAP
jgi:hypothetical protein